MELKPKVKHGMAHTPEIDVWGASLLLMLVHVAGVDGLIPSGNSYLISCSYIPLPQSVFSS